MTSFICTWYKQTQRCFPEISTKVQATESLELLPKQRELWDYRSRGTLFSYVIICIKFHFKICSEELIGICLASQVHLNICFYRLKIASCILSLWKHFKWNTLWVQDGGGHRKLLNVLFLVWHLFPNLPKTKTSNPNSSLCVKYIVHVQCD